jgi:DNA-binding transcriptional MerR regulator
VAHQLDLRLTVKVTTRGPDDVDAVPRGSLPSLHSTGRVDSVTRSTEPTRPPVAEPPAEQQALFDDETVSEHAGYRGPAACRAAGITYRQLDYWARTGLVEPSVRSATGSGSQRLYSFRDILVLRVVNRLLEAGVSLPNIRTAIGHLRDRGAHDLAQLTLVSDGTTVYELASPDDVVDLLREGQGVFAIAVGRVAQDVRGSLSALPSEAPRDAGEHGDELAARRRRRDTA